MSDIAIRFDGLLLGALLASGAMIFIGVAGVAAVIIWIRKPGKQRSWKVVSRSFWLALAHSAGLAILIGYLVEYGAPHAGPDWLDWLSLPCLIGIVIGLLSVFRTRTVGKGV